MFACPFKYVTTELQVTIPKYGETLHVEGEAIIKLGEMGDRVSTLDASHEDGSLAVYSELLSQGESTVFDTKSTCVVGNHGYSKEGFKELIIILDISEGEAVEVIVSDRDGKQRTDLTMKQYDVVRMFENEAIAMRLPSGVRVLMVANMPRPEDKYLFKEELL